jgi:formyl-CoA transferase
MRENRGVIQETLRRRFREESTAHWIARLEERDLLCAPVRSLAEALEDPQTKENGMVVESGEVKMVAAPVHLSEAPFEIRHAPPHLGEHSNEILKELGYDAGAIEKLREEGIVA